jgi:hypothetical protein
MVNKMKISEVPQVAVELDNDFIFAFCTFLDEFYHADGEEKKMLLIDEPIEGILNKEQYCMLACAAHKLANDYELDTPEWVMKKKYIMLKPVYAFDTKNKEYQEFLRTTSPEEYSSRNIFYGSNILKRV